MEAVITSKTYVNLYQTPLRKIPKTDIFMLVAVKKLEISSMAELSLVSLCTTPCRDTGTGRRAPLILDLENRRR
jgi:hypothetical protein